MLRKRYSYNRNLNLKIEQLLKYSTYKSVKTQGNPKKQTLLKLLNDKSFSTTQNSKFQKLFLFCFKKFSIAQLRIVSGYLVIK